MLNNHHSASLLKDKFALGLVKFLRFFVDFFFQDRYANRAIVIETVAAVPGMVGAGLLHFRCLRWMKDDQGWIRKLLDEAENERMHLMTFVVLAQPNFFERLIIFLAQGLFVVVYLIMYTLSSATAHRFVGYLEEEAVKSYSLYLEKIERGEIENLPAPEIAKTYWKLPMNATLKDVIVAVRNDEMGHRDVNHALANRLAQKEQLLRHPKFTDSK